MTKEITPVYDRPSPDPATITGFWDRKNNCWLRNKEQDVDFFFNCCLGFPEEFVADPQRYELTSFTLEPDWGYAEQDEFGNWS